MKDNMPEVILDTVMDIKETVQFFKGHFSAGITRKMVNSGEIPHFRQGNKKLLFDADELKLWWDARIKQSIKPKQEQSGYGTLRKIKV